VQMCYGCIRVFHLIERAVRSGGWKLIESDSGNRELYDLSTDPAEARDLYTGNQQIAAAIASRMDTYRKRIRSAAAAAAKLDQDALETLKSLGYVQ
jgi:arylsulfatase A-like enzyme